MSDPRLTVGIPFFNEERYLADAIRSVLSQTMGDFELLLVDDGSRDSSLDLARTFERDARVRILSDGKRLGLPARLNQVVELARGPLVARMDGDDVSHPRRFERQLMLLGQEREISAVGTWAALVDEEERIFGIVESSAPASARTALERGVLSHATMIARREWLREYPYDEGLTRAEDRDLWCRTVDRARFAVIPEPLYVVRVRPTAQDFLRDYVKSQEQNRTLYLRYGPKLIGVRKTARAWVASHAKSLVMQLAARAGMADRVVSRRGRAATESEARLVEEALGRVHPSLVATVNGRTESPRRAPAR